jgi:glucan phosphorylase
MKESIRTLSPQFCMIRMVKEYIEQLYVQALHPDIVPYDILD